MIFKEVEGNLKSEKNTFVICLATSRVPPLKGMSRHKRRVLSVHELWRDQSKRGRTVLLEDGRLQSR